MNAVMGMYDYSELQRLRAEDHIGQSRHITVQRRYTSAFPLHWHNYFEIEIILSGAGKHILNGTEHPLGRGDAYILTPVDFHEVEVTSPVELINISFDEACLPESMVSFLSATDVTKRCQPGEAEFARLVMAAELLRHECSSDGPCKRQLLEYLLSCFMRHCSDQRSQPVGPEYLTGLRSAIAYMELHFREKISLAQLSQLSGYNPTYFSELFRKVTGQSYIQRLKELRLHYAAMLLRSGLSVSDACYASGFGSLSNFLAAFKEKYGMAPSEYQNVKRPKE